jgi:hypothetical protein
MSANATEAGLPVPWSYQDKTYQLGHTDFELELYFELAQESWALNRIEAGHSRVGDSAYFAQVQAHGDRVAGNRFAFGGSLSLQFLATRAGQFEYLLLKLQKGQQAGGARMDRDKLQVIMRADKPAFDKLAEEVLGRDFPTVFRRESPTPATPTPSSTESVSSSEESPGESQNAKS